MNSMKQIKIEKVTLNIGAGKDQNLLNKGKKLLEMIAGVPPVQTVTQKRIPGWGLRPGLPIGCKITLRGKKAEEILSRMIKSKESRLKESCFDSNGNVSFGIHEYIDIPGVEYEPEIGIIGLQVSVTLKRPGYRIKNKRISTPIGKKHLIGQKEAMDFFKENFKVQVGE